MYFLWSIMDKIEKSLTFEEKLKNRIRESIGELLSDEDLKKILERGVDEALFQRKQIPVNSWEEVKFSPSFVDKTVQELLGEKMKEVLTTYLKENTVKLDQAISDAVKIGIGNCLITSLNDRFRDLLITLPSAIRQQLEK